MCKFEKGSFKCITCGREQTYEEMRDEARTRIAHAWGYCWGRCKCGYPPLPIYDLSPVIISDNLTVEEKLNKKDSPKDS